MEGKLKGTLKDFPVKVEQITLQVEGNQRSFVPVKYEIKDHKELFEIIEHEQEGLKKVDKKLHHIIQDLGIDTIQVCDRRTLSILENYLYYSSPATGPAPFDSKLWFESVLMLNNILTPRMF